MSDPLPPSPPEAVDELRRIIHDLNGDIFLIRTCSEILIQQNGSDHERLMDYLGKMADRTHRMEATVKALRRFKEERGL